MSIQIDQSKCIACGRCCNICPGNLIEQNASHNKAVIKYPRECWGCTACLKECPVGAIKYYLGADIGGKGGYLYTKNNKSYLDWLIVSADGTEHHVKIDKQAANKY